ncbi:MAG TPA: hypothetical protein PK295_03640 [Candidatus Magasanikbacteria bacterium]|nr:hypothetical protein [Candidatus Magasanikbacteria bacterium]
MSQSVQAMKVTKGPDKFTLMVAVFMDQEDGTDNSVFFTVEYGGSDHRLVLRVDKVERVRCSGSDLYRVQGYGVLHTLNLPRVTVFEHLPITVAFSTRNRTGTAIASF